MMHLKPSRDDLTAMREFLDKHHPGYQELQEAASFLRTEVASLPDIDPKARRTLILTCDLAQKPIGQMTRGELQWLAVMVSAVEG